MQVVILPLKHSHSLHTSFKSSLSPTLKHFVCLKQCLDPMHIIYIYIVGKGQPSKLETQMEKKSKVLVVGGTGYLGKRIVKASLANGHPTYVLHRHEIGVDIEKVQMLLSFKEQGARLVEGSLSDHQSLVDAVKQVDVVICAISGVHIRSHQILLQLKLVDAIRDAGNIKVSFYIIVNMKNRRIRF